MNLHPDPTITPVTMRQAIAHLACRQPDGREYKRELIETWRRCPPGKSLRKIVPTVSSFESVRLDPDKPSTTQTRTHFNWHYEFPRYLTIREMALIGSFSDAWRWPSSREISKKLIGNSVPPLFMRSIALHIRKFSLDNILSYTYLTL